MQQYFSSPIMDIIRSRQSVRTFQRKSLTPELRQKLLDYMEHVDELNGKPLRLLLLDGGAAPNAEKLGTYGIIKDAQHYIAAVTEKGDEACLLELGYKLEKVLLFACSLGLGGVWLGGTFSKGQFSKATRLTEAEILPIVMPIGYPAQDTRLLERMMKKFTGSANRMEWKDIFFDGETLKSLRESEAGPYQDAFEAVRLAPSAMNAQPWRVIRGKDRCYFYKATHPANNGPDMHTIDMGIALSHFDLAAHEAGLMGNWVFEVPGQIPAPDDYEFIAAWQQK